MIRMPLAGEPRFNSLLRPSEFARQVKLDGEFERRKEREMILSGEVIGGVANSFPQYFSHILWGFYLINHTKSPDIWSWESGFSFVNVYWFIDLDEKPYPVMSSAKFWCCYDIKYLIHKIALLPPVLRKIVLVSKWPLFSLYLNFYMLSMFSYLNGTHSCSSKIQPSFGVFASCNCISLLSHELCHLLHHSAYKMVILMESSWYWHGISYSCITNLSP